MEPELEKTLVRLGRKASPALLAVCGLLILVGLDAWRSVLKTKTLAAQVALKVVEEQAGDVREALADARSQRAQRAKQLASFKKGLPKLAEDRRQIYEEGLALQEEKRLLEKQLEIMTTYLLVEGTQVHVMRGEQRLESFPLTANVPRSYGGAEAARALDAVISKERFAHPERPKSEQVDGQLQYEPPQVGTSARANALGEYVVFTRGALILHGPPLKRAEHDAYKHACLELTLPIAKKLYAQTYIGTRVVVKH